MSDFEIIEYEPECSFLEEPYVTAGCWVDDPEIVRVIPNSRFRSL